jgi:hypothetical protein
VGERTPAVVGQRLQQGVAVSEISGVPETARVTAFEVAALGREERIAAATVKVPGHNRVAQDYG